MNRRVPPIFVGLSTTALFWVSWAALALTADASQKQVEELLRCSLRHHQMMRRITLTAREKY